MELSKLERSELTFMIAFNMYFRDDQCLLSLAP
jgi:hypothetical protein